MQYYFSTLFDFSYNCLSTVHLITKKLHNTVVQNEMSAFCGTFTLSLNLIEMLLDIKRLPLCEACVHRC